MFVTNKRLIKEAWEQGTRKKRNSIKYKIILTIYTEGKTVQMEGQDMKLKGISISSVIYSGIFFSLTTHLHSFTKT